MKLSPAQFRKLPQTGRFREQEIQKACVSWFRLQYPGYLLYANYNNAKNKKIGGINQGMGVMPGVADLTLLFSGQVYYIEVKTPKGRQSDAQKLFEERATDQRAEYHIVRSLDEFMALIKSILNVTF